MKIQLVVICSLSGSAIVSQSVHLKTTDHTRQQVTLFVGGRIDLQKSTRLRESPLDIQSRGTCSGVSVRRCRRVESEIRRIVAETHYKCPSLAQLILIPR